MAGMGDGDGSSVSAGKMTWKEFKAAVEAEGVTDDMQILYIDMSGQHGVNNVVIGVYPPPGDFYVE